MSNRLFRTRCYIGKASEMEAGIDGQEATVAFMVDLEEVTAVRATWDFDTDRIMPLRTILEMSNGDAVAIEAEAEAVMSAWLSYRTHADALTRIRN